MNWKTRIIKAKKRGRFTIYEEVIAGSFNTCATSELKNTGLLSYDMRPHDEKLLDLSRYFMFAIQTNNLLLAEPIYNKIHKLAKKLGKQRKEA